MASRLTLMVSGRHGSGLGHGRRAGDLRRRKSEHVLFSQLEVVFSSSTSEQNCRHLLSQASSMSGYFLCKDDEESFSTLAKTE